ncbi:carboxypeptidase B-like [Gordionus sp. m RMFG-2023]|uniref:carboxypeptidase B-like n=1 Tax=Gordionus sp. m RMFG-2023 TaxID=3053472 RepID=UPI0031FE204E
MNILIILIQLITHMPEILSIKSYSGFKLIKLQTKNDLDFKKIYEFQVNHTDNNIWSYYKNGSGMNIDIMISKVDYQNFISLLNKLDIEYAIKLDDIQKLIDFQKNEAYIARLSISMTSFDFEYYPRMAEVYYWFEFLAEKYPKLVTIIDIGESYEGRRMKILKIGRDTGSKKPAFFVDGGIHAREWPTVTTAMYFISRTNFFVLKTSHIRVSLFKYLIACSHGVAYDNPCEVIYQGLSPFSEIETRNLADFIRSRRWDILSYLTIHAYSQMWMYPFAYTYDNAPDHEELSDLMREAKKSAPNYKIGSVAQLLYAVTGSSLDWAYDDMKIKYSFVIELKDMGHGFLLPSTKILPVASEVWTIYEYIISYVLNRETGYK